MFKYNAVLDRVVDGDTLDAIIDLGFYTWKKTRIRFYGINTPESRTRDLEEKKRGLAAKDRLIEILQANDNKFILQSHGVGKYGRCLGELYVETLGETSIQQTLINEGHGVAYFGGKR
jgi:micrococcal nuclease